MNHSQIEKVHEENADWVTEQINQREEAIQALSKDLHRFLSLKKKDLWC